MSKKTHFTIAVALLLLTPISQASDWSEADTRREVAYQALLTIDWRQTLDIADKCGHTTYYEQNPILGKCPSKSEVTAYFAAGALVHYGISRALPPKHRKWWQNVTLTLQAGTVAHNASIGLDVRF